MEKKTQHQKLIEMCKDGEWHCQTDFRLHSWSPHKRRDDIVEGRTKHAIKGHYKFEERSCEHGISGSKDYRMIDLWASKPKGEIIEVEGKPTYKLPEQTKLT